MKNMSKNDGNDGGRMYVVRKNSQANENAYSKDGGFTLLCLTYAIGDPVMCVIINSVYELSYDEQAGVDIRVSLDKASVFEEKLGPGKTHPGGPKCIYVVRRFPSLSHPTQEEVPHTKYWLIL